MKSIKIITLCMLNIDVDCNPPPKKKKKNSYKNSELQNKIDKLNIIMGEFNTSLRNL